jgi:hypothetical protein
MCGLYAGNPDESTGIRPSETPFDFSGKRPHFRCSPHPPPGSIYFLLLFYNMVGYDPSLMKRALGLFSDELVYDRASGTFSGILVYEIENNISPSILDLVFVLCF